jgi:hypothetical protein
MTQQQQFYPQPPRKKHTVRNVLLITSGIMLAFVVACSAVVANGMDEAVNGSVPDTTQSTPGTVPDRGAPRAVAVGKAFTIGKHRFESGWKVATPDYGSPQITGTVTNVSEETSTAFFHIKYLNGSKVVANFQCSTNDLEPRQSEDVECYNMVDNSGRIGKYTKVTAEATF